MLGKTARAHGPRVVWLTCACVTLQGSRWSDPSAARCVWAGHTATTSLCPRRPLCHWHWMCWLKCHRYFRSCTPPKRQLVPLQSCTTVTVVRMCCALSMAQHHMLVSFTWPLPPCCTCRGRCRWSRGLLRGAAASMSRHTHLQPWTCHSTVRILQTHLPPTTSFQYALLQHIVDTVISMALGTARESLLKGVLLHLTQTRLCSCTSQIERAAQKACL